MWWFSPALDAGFFYCLAAMPGNAPAECWAALTGSGRTFFDNRKAGKSTPIIPALITVRRNVMVWIYYKFARVEQLWKTKAAQLIA
jgi:hypothetical protein